MRIFAPSLVEGSAMVLMDWQFDIGPPQEWMRQHADCFEPESLCSYPSQAAVFKRTAGRLQ